MRLGLDACSEMPVFRTETSAGCDKKKQGSQSCLNPKPRQNRNGEVLGVSHENRMSVSQ